MLSNIYHNWFELKNIHHNKLTVFRNTEEWRDISLNCRLITLVPDTGNSRLLSLYSSDSDFHIIVILVCIFTPEQDQLTTVPLIHWNYSGIKYNF